MDRYTLGFLLLVGWFVVFRMFPADLSSASNSTCGVVDSDFTDAEIWNQRVVLSEAALRGKMAFQANCARCHNTNISKKATGPALLGVSSRMPPGDWIYAWVGNSAKLIASGDAYANKIWRDNNKASMDPFPDLSRETIDDIMAWINAF